jgi:tetratricopeptide (TPR) repeat protein
MILRLSTASGRGALAVIAAVAFAFLAFLSVRDALAAYFLGGETFAGISRATRLEPKNPGNWFALGRYWQYNFENPDLDKAIQAYQRAIALDPRSSDVWLDLGTAYEAVGRILDARDAFSNAKRIYPLSAQVAWTYGNFLLRQGDLAIAFSEIRAAVLADPRRGGEAFSRCIRVEPNIDKIFDAVIPPSAPVYLDIIRVLADSDQTADALRIWDRLLQLQPQPKLQLRLVYQLVDALRRQHLVPDASRVWAQAAALSGFANLGDPSDSAIWDGGFESGETGLGYSWNYFPNAHGVQIRVQSQEKHSGTQSLRVTFDGHSDLNFRDVCHLIPLRPSTSYRFSAWVRGRELSTDRGVHFVLAGSSQTTEPPLITKDMLGTFDWQQVTADWTSPSAAMEGQLCLARLPSDQPDNKIRGTLWLDDVAIVPVDSKSPKQ